jgi:type II secretory pathway component HofQ
MPPRRTPGPAVARPEQLVLQSLASVAPTPVLAQPRLSRPLFPQTTAPANESSGEPGHAVAITADTPNKLRGLTGIRVSLNFRDAEIADIARIIAEKAGLNIVSRKPIVGRTTVRLDNIPVGNALDIILKGNDYSYEVKDDIIWILQKGDEPSETMIFFIKQVRASDLQPLVKYSLDQDEAISAAFPTDSPVTTPGVSAMDTGSAPDQYGPPAPVTVLAPTAPRSATPRRWSVILDDRSNALIVTAPRRKLEEIGRMVAAMDFNRGGQAVMSGALEERIFKLKFIEKDTLIK